MHVVVMLYTFAYRSDDEMRFSAVLSAARCRCSSPGMPPRIDNSHALLQAVLVALHCACREAFWNCAPRIGLAVGIVSPPRSAGTCPRVMLIPWHRGGIFHDRHGLSIRRGRCALTGWIAQPGRSLLAEQARM